MVCLQGLWSKGQRSRRRTFGPGDCPYAARKVMTTVSRMRRALMKARDATRHAPVQLPAHATIGEAARLMDTEAVGAVVITDSSTVQPIGIVTDRDLVVQALARGVPTN